MFKRIIITIFLAFFVGFCFAQNIVTYSASYKSISSILSDLESLTKLNFSYNSDIINGNKLVSVSVKNESLEVCLTKILGSNYEFKQIGNQVVITQKKQQPNSFQPTKDVVKKEKTVFIYDTIPVYDTIYQRITYVDTLNVIDTVKRFKTVTMKRYETNYMHTKKNCNIFSARTGIHTTLPQFYGGKSYSNSLQEIHKSLMGFGAQFDCIAKRNKFLLQTGINYYDFRSENTFQTQSFIDEKMNTYVDTNWYWSLREVFRYYKFNESGDSVAVSVVDSILTFNTVEHPKKIENITNKISTVSWQYVSIPLGIGYHCNLSNTFALQLLVSGNVMILVHSNGEIVNEAQTNTIPIDRYMRCITFSSTVSCNIIYSIEKQYSVSVRPFCNITPGIFKTRESSSQCLLSNFGIEWGFSYTIPND